MASFSHTTPSRARRAAAGLTTLVVALALLAPGAAAQTESSGADSSSLVPLMIGVMALGVIVVVLFVGLTSRKKKAPSFQQGLFDAPPSSARPAPTDTDKPAPSPESETIDEPAAVDEPSMMEEQTVANEPEEAIEPDEIDGPVEIDEVDGPAENDEVNDERVEPEAAADFFAPPADAAASISALASEAAAILNDEQDEQPGKHRQSPTPPDDDIPDFRLFPPPSAVDGGPEAEVSDASDEVSSIADDIQAPTLPDDSDFTLPALHHVVDPLASTPAPELDSVDPEEVEDEVIQPEPAPPVVYPTAPPPPFTPIPEPASVEPPPAPTPPPAPVEPPPPAPVEPPPPAPVTAPTPPPAPVTAPPVSAATSARSASGRDEFAESLEERAKAAFVEAHSLATTASLMRARADEIRNRQELSRTRAARIDRGARIAEEQGRPWEGRVAAVATAVEEINDQRAEVARLSSEADRLDQLQDQARRRGSRLLRQSRSL